MTKIRYNQLQLDSKKFTDFCILFWLPPREANEHIFTILYFSFAKLFMVIWVIPIWVGCEKQNRKMRRSFISQTCLLQWEMIKKIIYQNIYLDFLPCLTKKGKRLTNKSRNETKMMLLILTLTINIQKVHNLFCF